MRRIRLFLQHALNPLHVYCRLADLGMGRKSARKVCRVYERFVYGIVL